MCPVRHRGLCALVISLLISPLLAGRCAAAQGGAGSLRVEVVDQLGAFIVNATVVVRDAGGKETKVTDNERGVYLVPSLAPGPYTVLVDAPGFAPVKDLPVEVSAQRAAPLRVTMQVRLESQEEVRVEEDGKLSTDPEQNHSSLILKGTDLDALPDDPDDLAAALQAMAGPGAGPGGAQFYVDGFSHSALPPKQSIREIRINQNPFSAEYDQLGFGRIDIFTKPGEDKFHGQGFLNFNDESLNSRNPFASHRPPYQARLYGGGVNGPIVAGRASFTLDFERRDIDDAAVVNAVVLNRALDVEPLNLSVLTPQRRTALTGRLDIKLNKDHNLTGRYLLGRMSLDNAGVGDFALPSRAANRRTSNHNLQLTETGVLSPAAVNVLRLQYVRNSARRTPESDAPGVVVLDAFTGGGSSGGQASSRESRLELQDYILLSKDQHSIKFGLRLRHASITDISPSDFNGTFTFTGGLAPQLGADNQVVIDPATGTPVLTQITSIERYQRTLLLQSLQLTPDEVRARGGGASQFSLAAGDPAASVGQTDIGLFVQDDWRARQNLTLSFGLRYEWQDNISSNLNFAPRLAFAWAPGGGKRQAKTVVRGGFGYFYTRVEEDLTLRANRFNGVTQQNYILTDPDFFPNIPPPSAIPGALQAQTTRPLAPGLRAAYIMQYALGVERRLPFGLTGTATYIGTRMLHGLRSRNINAPLPGTFSLDDPTSGVRPFGDIGNIFQVESSARLNQQQLVVNLESRLREEVTLFGVYVLSRINNDAIGAGIFPANSYDLSGEYGRSALDLRHRLTLAGTIKGPGGFVLNPFVLAFSNRPFNITTGRDLNGDAVFADRPAFATDLTRPSVVLTRFGAFDTEPLPGQQIIPRNYGIAPGFFSVNLRVSRTFNFTHRTTSSVVSSSGQRRSKSTTRRYGLTLAVQVQNLLNHTNGATPIGNLSSPLFGRSVAANGGLGAGGGGSASAANRRVEAQLRFSF
jgi:hypothetical protein